MRIHDAVFYGIVFFLLGIILASLSIKFSITLIIAALLAIFFLLANHKNKKHILFALLSVLVVAGSLYYEINDQMFRGQIIPYGESAIINGVVINEPETRSADKRFRIKLNDPHSGRILVHVDRFADIDYGDLLRIETQVKEPEPSGYANYLAKERVSGIAVFPEIKKVGTNQGSKIKSTLFKIKLRATDVFRRSLSAEKSAFMSGITFGERAEFSEEFKNKMSLSGTTHLVALSGYNVTIISIAVAGIFGYFLSRKISFYLTVLTIIGFVIMTGADPSIIRAAIMGIIVLLAHQTMRIYSFRNAIAIAAFLMVVFNPKVLVYDIGFQLSFLALLGIVYLKPAIQRFFKIPRTKSLLNWKENALVTVSAQLAVIPVLLLNFNQFSFAAFPANILILEAIPFTMLLGFLMVLFGLFIFPVAVMIGWVANIFLSYELFLIDFFSKFEYLSIGSSHFNLFGALIYFTALVSFVLFSRRAV